jgi:hypothetical protein
MTEEEITIEVEEEPNIENNWNSKIEKSLEEIMEDLNYYSSTHLKNANKYLRRYNYLMNLGLILGPLVGLLSSINMIINDEDVIPILMTVVPFLNGIVISMIKFSNYEQKSNEHKLAHSRFGNLFHLIKRQLSLNHNDRENSNLFFNKIVDSYTTLIEASPLVKEKHSNIKPEDNSKSVLSIDKMNKQLVYEMKRFNNT